MAAPLDPLFDLASLEARVGNDPPLLRELLTLFAAVQPARTIDLHDALQRADADQARRTAHQLAGAFASLSMGHAASLSRAIELAASEGALAHALTVLAQLDAVVARILERLIALSLIDPTGDMPPRPASALPDA